MFTPHTTHIYGGPVGTPGDSHEGSCSSILCPCQQRIVRQGAGCERAVPCSRYEPSTQHLLSVQLAGGITAQMGCSCSEHWYSNQPPALLVLVNLYPRQPTAAAEAQASSHEAVLVYLRPVYSVRMSAPSQSGSLVLGGRERAHKLK